MAGRFRVVQVGLGAWGRSWAEVARAAQGCELVGLVDQFGPARDWAVNELGFPEQRVHASLEQALAAGPADAVLVVSPPATHRAVVSEALAANQHVLVEKPLATTVEDARMLVDAAATADRVLLVSQNYRYRAPAQTVRRLVAEGVIGRLVAVEAACRRDTRDVFPAGDFRFAMEHPYLLDMAIHHLDLLRAVTGDDVVELVARSWRVPDSPYEHDPAMAALLRLGCGAVVHYQGDWATRAAETSWNADWTLIGEHGRITWTGPPDDLLAGEVLLTGEEGPARLVDQVPLEHVDRHGTLQALRRAVEERAEVDIRARDNLNSLAMVMGCVESIKTGRLVELGRAA